MFELTLYSRPGCHLCDDMATALLPLLRPAGHTLQTVDIDTDPDLQHRYGWRIPVLVLDGEVICEGRLDEDAVRDALGRQ
ncbi:MAG TPA: glutaredoxin family protein [Gammaproteobacteria bacterium]